MRSPDVVLGLISGLDVVNSFAFLPHVRLIDGKPTPMLTLCNAYTNVVTSALGCPIPALLANKQAAWLAGPLGVAAGWRSIDKAQALERANDGFPVVAVAFNDTGHGHIAPVVPSPPEDKAALYVSSAGATNFVRARIGRSFGALVPQFYTHD